MTPERYQQIKRVFAEACRRSGTERTAYLEQACARDAELRGEVDSLLAHDQRSLPGERRFSAAAILGLAEATDAKPRADGATDADARAGAWPAAHLPAQIGRYRVLRKIGEGGMGVVLEAEQDHPRRTVALKVISPGIASEQVLRRFKLEVEALGRLQHPGIAQVFEAGTAELRALDGSVTEQPFFAMELVRGASLSAFVRRRNLGTRARLELLAKICDGVEHAHQQGVIHRDLKPGNILVDESGQPKILDFGVAHLTDTDVQRTTLCTDAGQLIGTLAYMSPEQAAGDARRVDARSDVYALGVLIYQVLAGRLPYDLSHQPIPEATRTIVEREPTPLSLVSRAFRGDLTTIVSKSLEKDRERRYPSAGELAQDLRRYLASEPITARPASTLYQMGKFARRNPALVGGVLTAFAALSIGLAGTAWQAVRATHERNRALEAERAAERSRADAEAQRNEAQRQTAVAEAVNRFLTEDLLAAASPERERDPQITVRAVLDRAAGAIGDRFEQQPLVEAAVRYTLADVYRALGDYESAEPHAVRSVDLRRAALGAEDPLTLTSKQLLAGIYSNRGRYAESEALFVEVLAVRQRTLGEAHRSTLATMNLLGLLYGRQGRDTDAEPLLLQALELTERTLGAEHESTLIALDNLADLRTRQKRFDEAERLYRRELEVYRRIEGEEHFQTATVISKLAALYSRQRRFDEAEPLCLKAVEIRRRLLGENHPRTLYALNTLAVLYRQQRRYDEAEPLLLQVLEAKRHELGEEHPDTLVSMNNLGNLYAVQRRFEEAEPLFLATIAARRRVLGEQHPLTLSTMGNLAEMYRAMGRTEDAAQWRAKLPTTQAATPRARAEGEGD